MSAAALIGLDEDVAKSLKLLIVLALMPAMVSVKATKDWTTNYRDNSVNPAINLTLIGRYFVYGGLIHAFEEVIRFTLCSSLYGWSRLGPIWGPALAHDPTDFSTDTTLWEGGFD